MNSGSIHSSSVSTHLDSSFVGRSSAASSRVSKRMSLVLKGTRSCQSLPPEITRSSYSHMRTKRGATSERSCQRQFNGNWFDGESVLTIDLNDKGCCPLPGGKLNTEEDSCSLRDVNGDTFVGFLLPGARSISWSDDEVWQRISDRDYLYEQAKRQRARSGRQKVMLGDLRASIDRSNVNAPTLLTGAPRMQPLGAKRLVSSRVSVEL